ncbi:MAG: hypothetical protein GTN74_05240 [Proteobacteria bacterium]|nr:hypothetical protein [Pseudomonadota bacterium]NIS68894.1 hypothetical protein [Pseudomonadota bacterium]
MGFYCGIDVHARDCFVCIIDDQDKIHLKSKIPNHLPSILDWLVKGLLEAGFEVKLAHTMGLFMITGAKVKTDRRDAFSLARLLRLGAIPEAYIYPKDQRPIRDLLRRRNRLVFLRAAVYGDLRRTLLQYGLLGYSRDEIKGLSKAEIVQNFEHPVLRLSGQLQLERISLYSRQIKDLEEMILATVAEEPVITNLNENGQKPIIFCYHLRLLGEPGQPKSLTVKSPYGCMVRMASGPTVKDRVGSARMMAAKS